MSWPLEGEPPKLLRKQLDDAGLEEHLVALANQAQKIELRIKEAAEDHSSAGLTPLEEAGRRLIAGEIVAVQIRFFQDEAWWCDTLMRDKEGFRLVRMRQG